MSKVKYFHLRWWDSVYNNYATKGGKTIAYAVKGKSLVYAVAECSDDDVYCKETGRKLSLERFNAGFPFVATTPYDKSISPAQTIATLFGVEEVEDSEEDDFDAIADLKEFVNELDCEERDVLLNLLIEDFEANNCGVTDTTGDATEPAGAIKLVDCECHDQVHSSSCG